MKLIDRLKERARSLKSEITALYYAFRHPKVSPLAKLWIIVVVSYALSPIDLIPDFIPVLGYLDDLLLVPLGIVIAKRLIPAEILDECRKKAMEEPIRLHKNPVAAIVIIAIWALTLFWLVRSIAGLIEK